MFQTSKSRAPTQQVISSGRAQVKGAARTISLSRSGGNLATRTPATVLIGNVSPDLGESDLKSLCDRYGNCQVTLRAVDNGTSEAEVVFASRQDAISAIRELDGSELDNDGYPLTAGLLPQ